MSPAWSGKCFSCISNYVKPKIEPLSLSIDKFKIHAMNELSFTRIANKIPLDVRSHYFLSNVYFIMVLWKIYGRVNPKYYMTNGEIVKNLSLFHRKKARKYFNNDFMHKIYLIFKLHNPMLIIKSRQRHIEYWINNISASIRKAGIAKSVITFYRNHKIDYPYRLPKVVATLYVYYYLNRIKHENRIDYAKFAIRQNFAYILRKFEKKIEEHFDSNVGISYLNN